MENKKLKFRHHLVEEVLSGQKNVTWRLFDDKDLKVGDRLDLIEYDNNEKFAEAEIINVYEKPLGSIEEKDFEGHEKYQNKDEMLETYTKYYGDSVNWGTIVKIIKFELKK